MQPFTVTSKRRRLMKNGNFVGNNVVEIISSDEENTLKNREILDSKKEDLEKKVCYY